MTKLMYLYKLTNKNNQTYDETQWGLNVEHRVDGTGNLCGSGFLHAYTSPLLAVLLNPIHANFQNPRLWKAEGDVAKTNGGLKVGCTRLKTTREIPLPKVTMEQKIKFAILCAKHVYKDRAYNDWADRWLNGEDRSLAAAARAAMAAARVAEEAWAAAGRRLWAVSADWAAARAAEWAARAAEAVARATAWAAARAAEEAVEAVARAAEWAAAIKPIDLISLAKKAMQ